MQNLIGTRIEHYQILVRIRESPTRILYRAYDTRVQNYRALEVVKAAGGEPAELLRLINEQTRKNTELVHPNIATISDIGLSEGLIYIVYNFAPTQPFRRVFNRTYGWREMARELVSITHALAYAHEKGVVHGALHPSSIVLDEKRNPILFDFGFEQLITDYLLAHAPGTWVNHWGFEYRAPEQFSGAIPNERGDIYAVGMMLNEWLTGTIPLLDSTVLGTLHLRKSTRETTYSTSAIPAVIQNLIQKCIARNPADRYQSMQEVYIVLARGALDMTITQKMVRKPLEVAAQPINWRRLSTPLVLVGILVLAVIAFMSSLVWYPRALAAFSPSPMPSKIPATPTRVVQPTLTPAIEVPASPTATTVRLNFPVFQGTPLASAVKQTLRTDNINDMVMLSHWGIGDVNDLVVSPDGKQVAVASSMGLFVFDAQSLKLETYVDTLTDGVTALSFSPDGQTLATGGSDGLIQLWDTHTWQEAQARYSGHNKAILDLAFSPDGTKLASASLDNSLIQWQLNSVDDTTPMRAELVNGLNAVAYSTDSTRLVSGGNDFQVRVWDSRKLTVLRTIPFSGKILDIAGVPGSDRFVIGGNNQEVELLDLTAGGTLTIDVGRLRYPLTGVAVSPTGKTVVAGNIRGGIAAWDISGEESKELWTSKNYAVDSLGDLTAPGSRHSLAFSPDANRIFSGLSEGVIRSVDSTTGEDAGQNQSLNTHVKKLAVSHNSQYLLAQLDNGQTTLWDLWKGALVYEWPGEIIDGDPFSQNDRMLTLVLNRTEVKVYDPSSGQERFTFDDDRAVKTVQFIRDGSQLVIVYDQVARLWSMVSGEELKTTRRYEGTGCATIYDLNQDAVVSITKYYHVVASRQNELGLCGFSPLDWTITINEEGGLIAFGGSSKLSVLGLPGQGGQSQDMQGVNRKNIVRVALSQDGALLAAAFDDDTIHIWDIATKQEVGQELHGHSRSITDLTFSPDGKLLISSSSDGTIRLWGIPYQG
jgi:WD40 repeat protein/serine/threonine protein kinase